MDHQNPDYDPDQVGGLQSEPNLIEISHVGEIDASHPLFPKYFEKNQTIAYRKLVVPQSMRSVYWKFFGFPADDNGDILTRIKIVCLL